MDRHYPFDSLLEKVNHIKNNPVEITNMYSTAGNKRVSKLVSDTIDRIFNKVSRDAVIDELKSSWKVVQKQHPEVMESDIRESVFWYIDAACSWVRYSHISMDEILK